MYSNFSFEFKQYPNGSRLGKITTPHGIIETPAFAFCGTRATLKGLFPSQFSKSQILLCNTYHLHLQPGSELIRSFGGLHKFTGWNGPIFTDSGGYQIFSLGYGSVSSEIKGKRCGKRSIIDLSENGAVFRSYIDGSIHTLTPEISIDIQNNLGSDIALVLDECTPFNITEAYTYNSMLRSKRWATRSLEHFKKINSGKQALYGIIQGGVYEYMREESAEFINSNDFFGTAIGGTLGRTKDQMYEVLSYTSKYIEKSRPTHLLGIGCILDIINTVEFGIDTFDCVHPTRIARHGGALVKLEQRDVKEREHINILNSKYKNDQDPIDKDCNCATCKNFSKGYLHHLLKSKELLAMSAITLHNVEFMNNLMQEIRESIKYNSFDEMKRKWSV